MENLPKTITDSTGSKWELDHGYMGPEYWHEDSDCEWGASVIVQRGTSVGDVIAEIEDLVEFHFGRDEAQ